MAFWPQTSSFSFERDFSSLSISPVYKTQLSLLLVLLLQNSVKIHVYEMGLNQGPIFRKP